MRLAQFGGFGLTSMLPVAFADVVPNGHGTASGTPVVTSEAAQRREELRAGGLERARAFTWEAAAKATAEVYREAAA